MPSEREGECRFISPDEARERGLNGPKGGEYECPWCGRSLEPRGIMLNGRIAWVTCEPCGCDGEARAAKEAETREAETKERERKAKLVRAGVKKRYLDAKVDTVETQLYVERFGSDDGRGLYIHGDVGTGKTYLASALACVFIAAGYTVEGVLMLKSENKPPLDAEGNPVTASWTFKPTASSGTVELEFTFDASLLAGETVVVFEDLLQDGKVVATHADINDEGQSVKVVRIRTTATNETGGKTVTGTDVAIVDEVAYEGLTPGETYTLKATLMGAETGKPVQRVVGLFPEDVTAEADFTVEAASGKATVTLECDVSELGGIISWSSRSFTAPTAARSPSTRTSRMRARPSSSTTLTRPRPPILPSPACPRRVTASPGFPWRVLRAPLHVSAQEW